MRNVYLGDEPVRMNAMMVDQLRQGGKPGLSRHKVLKYKRITTTGYFNYEQKCCVCTKLQAYPHFNYQNL
jgi:hypothetical protein